MDAIVEKLQNLDVDMILIAGDFTYWPDKDDIPYLFESLGLLEVPVYAVLGNHDVERPGEFLKDVLVPTLENNNVMVLQNHYVELPEFTLLWLGSHMNGNDDISLLDNYSTGDNVVVLTHNPDTTLRYTNNIADLTLAGHTHGGQIRLPFVYKRVIPTQWDFDRDLTQEKNTQLFVTAWLGMTWLPMRLFNPPVIDVLHLQ